MTDKKKLSKNTLTKIDGVITVIILILSLKCIRNIMVNSQVEYLIGVVYFLVVIANLMQIYDCYDRSKLRTIFLVCHAVIYMTVGVVIIFTDMSYYPLMVSIFVCYFIFISNRVLSVIMNRSWWNIVLNTFWTGFILYWFIKFVTSMGDRFMDTLEMISIMIGFAGWGLFHILGIAFSQIQLNTLRKIIRKTYAAQVLFGLVLLICTFSYVFTIYEPAMADYTDALWYCFAIVTTIGFGDITAVTSVGRIMSVILGIYGIIVVALITSVIVNFYTEVKNEADEEERS